MAVSTSNIVSTLGAGSGIDIKALAESLVEAERAPLKARIDAQIGKSEARISGYGAMRSYLEQLKSSLEKLNEASDFGGLSVTNSQPQSLSVTLGAGAVSASHDISVLELASAQVSRSQGFASATGPINGGQPLTLSLTMNGATRDITVSAPASLEEIAKAINLDADPANANTGLKAQVVRYSKDGTTYHALEVQGRMGVEQGFALAIKPDSYLDGQQPADNIPKLIERNLQQASDARVMVNGQTRTYTSNTITDAVANATLTLGAVTSAPVRVSFNRDVQPVRDNIVALVSSYNDLQQALKELANSKSEVEDLGGSLVGDRLLQSVRSQMRSLLVGSDSGPSPINALRDLGITVDLGGRMVLDKPAKLDAALKDQFTDVVSMFSSSANSATGKGLAGDVIDAIDKLVSTKSYDKGQIQLKIDSAGKEVEKYKADLKKLEDRMERSLQRYMIQFSVMESIVGESTSTRAGLTNTFKAMMGNNN